jgi:fucose permease
VGDAGLGTALLWVGVGALITLRWAGGVSDRVGSRAAPLALGSLGVAGLLPAFAHGVGELSIALFVVGLCSGAADATINAAALRVEHAGRALLNLCHGVFSVAVVAASLGVAAGYPNGGGRPWPLVGTGAVIVAVAIPLAVVPVLRSAPVARASITVRQRRRIVTRPLVILGVLAAVAYLVENAWQSWAAIQLHTATAASPRTAAAAPAVFAGAAAVSRFAGHGVARRIRPATMVTIGALVASGGSALAASSHHAVACLAGVAVAGLGTAVCAPTLISLARHHADPADHGAATGTVVTIAYLGFVIGPALVGLAAGAFTLRVALVAVAAAAFGLACCGPLLSRLEE